MKLLRNSEADVLLGGAEDPLGARPRICAEFIHEQDGSIHYAPATRWHAVSVNGWLGRRRRYKQFRAAQTSTTPAVNAGVTIADLRSAITKLLDAAEATFGAELQLPEDFYWNVPLIDATQI